MEGPKKPKLDSPTIVPVATAQAPAPQPRLHHGHDPHHHHAEAPPRHVTSVPQPKRPVNPDASEFSEPQPDNPRELKKAKPEELPRPTLFDDEAIPMEIDDGLEWLSGTGDFDPELHAEMMARANEAVENARLRRGKAVAVLLEKLSTLNPSRANFLKEDFGSDARALWLFGFGLTKIPLEVWELSTLEVLNLSFTEISELPREISALVNLEVLDLSQSKIEALPVEIGQLEKLVSLELDQSRIQTLPAEIGRLINLGDLDISYTPLTTLPPEIGHLAKLTTLALWKTHITALPPEIGQLVNLQELMLGDTAVTVLPATIRNLENLRVLNLQGCPIAAHGDENNWGRAELIAHFGDRVVLDDPDEAPPIPASTTREEVYSALDAQLERIDRKQLASARLREIPGQAIEKGDEFMHVFNKVLGQLNFDEADAPGYLSYELLSGDYASDARDNKQSSSGDKIRRYVLPRLTGYFKELYGLPLSEGESKGWQMHEESKPALKKALSYILNQLASLTDPEQRSSLFYQFVQGMLHCPTGQKEGIETVVNALLEGKTERSERDLKTLVEKAIAAKKNAFFKTAILTKASANVQNVHLISTYQERLRDELGLSNLLAFKEQIGAMGRDPFSNNENNVLQVFYNLVTPQRLVDWIMERTPSEEDLKLRRDVGQFKPINAGVVGIIFRDEIENDEHGWKHFFTADPFDVTAPPAALTREGAMRVLQKLGYVIGNPQARSEG